MSDNDITDEDLKNSFLFKSIIGKDLIIKRTMSGDENIENEHGSINDRYHQRLCSKDFELDSPIANNNVTPFVLPQDDTNELEAEKPNENTKEQTIQSKEMNNTKEKEINKLSLNPSEFSGGSESGSDSDSMPKNFKRIVTNNSDSVQTRLNKLGIHNKVDKNGERVIDVSALKQENNDDISSEESNFYPEAKEGVNNYAWQPSRKLAHHSSEDEDDEEKYSEHIKYTKTKEENLQDVLIVQGSEANMKAKSLKLHKLKERDIERKQVTKEFYFARKNLWRNSTNFERVSNLLHNHKPDINPNKNEIFEEFCYNSEEEAVIIKMDDNNELQ